MSPTSNIKEKVAEVVLSYWRLTDTSPPTAQELAQWVDTLAPPVQTQLLALGLAKAIHLTVFKRYVLEKRGYSMQSYMRAKLTPEEFPYWIDDNDGGVRPD